MYRAPARQAPPLSRAPAPRHKRPPAAARSVALAHRESGIVHLQSQAREAGIGTKPRQRHAMTPLERAFLARELNREHQRVTQAAVAGAHPGLAAHLIGGIGRDPVGTLRAVTGIDLMRLAHPGRAVQHDYRKGEDVAAAYKRGDITLDEAVARAPKSEGMILSGPGGRLLARLTRRAPAEAGAAETAARDVVSRPRTRAEAEARLSVLDRQLERFHSEAAKLTGHPYAETDIARVEQARRNRINGLIDKFERTGVRARGTAKALRAGRQRTVRSELDAHAGQVLDSIAKRRPNDPHVRAYHATVEEANHLRAQLERSPEEVFGDAAPGPRDLGSETYSPIEEVRSSLGPARRARTEQGKLYSEERSARVGRGEVAYKEAGGGISGFKAAMRQQRGELPKVTFERLRQGKLQTADVEALVHHAWDHPELQHYEKLTVTKALLDAFEHGRTPTPSEIKLLQTAYGQEVAKALSHVPRLTKAGRIAVDVSNIPRTVMASVDLSAPMRQGLVAGARHPIIFARNFKPMIKAFGSERVYQAILDDIHSRPTFPQMEEAGVKFTELGRDAGQREEQFISYTAGRLPLVKSSARAYTAFLDKMRADMFDRQLELARKQGVNVEDHAELRSIARLVNNATGRGDLGPVESWAPALNAFFFSPRLIASRVNMLNPVWYATLTPFARKQAIYSMIRLGSVAGGVLALGSYAGAKVVSDPRNADFAKLRIGNTRADVLGGFQQYARVGSQLATGKIISSTTGKKMTLGPGFGDLSRKDIAERFVVGKFSPPPSFVYDFFKGTQFDGQPFSWKKAVLARTVPLVVQDAYDLYHNSDSIPLALLGYSISAFGIGMQTYGPKQPKQSGQVQGGGSLLRSGGSGGGSPLLRGGGSGSSSSLLRGP